MNYKDSWYLELTNDDGATGVGECSTIAGLSPEGNIDVDERLYSLCQKINQNGRADGFDFVSAPALRFALETAEADLALNGKRTICPCPLLEGEPIPINGLIWMGSAEFMLAQIRTKIDEGYNCIKLKVGAIDFETELEILKKARSEFGHDIILRVDANGGFSSEGALEKLNRLSELEIHSIEQPIAVGQYDELARLCEVSPIPIALDEELILERSHTDMQNLLDHILPQYLILKPSLLGGMQASEEWIRMAEERKIGWWVTSALESNIGLNAIAQWTSSLSTVGHQGLGTGQLFTNNIDSPLYIESGHLHYDNEKPVWARIF